MSYLRRDYKVDILVRGWENAALTYKCLSSIQRYTDPDLYQITYVDNGTNQGALFHLMQSFPKVNYVCLPFNHGSVRAINIGLAMAMLSPSDYVLLLDNDTEIPVNDREWLPRFISYFDDETVGAAGAVSDYVSGFQHCEALPDAFMKAWVDEDGRQRIKGHIELPVLVSFAMMIRKASFVEVGLFDEIFEPGNHEDFDYSLRLRQAGYKCVIANSVWIHHKGSQTFSKMGFDELLATNGKKMVDKWGLEVLADMGLEVGI